jgi:cation diffusion facilitator CzcD-associated flavoprotein CzcO
MSFGACQVPSHLYSYSFALNPEWSEQFASQSEIEAYCRSVAEKYGIPRHIAFRSTVQGATFNEASGTWVVRILDQKTGQVFERRSRVLISAVGLLSEPNDCDIPGAEDYKGKLFHSARWDSSFDWAGKDVVVVGAFSPSSLLPSQYYTNMARRQRVQRYAIRTHSNHRPRKGPKRRPIHSPAELA